MAFRRRRIIPRRRRIIKRRLYRNRKRIGRPRNGPSAGAIATATKLLSFPPTKLVHFRYAVTEPLAINVGSNQNQFNISCNNLSQPSTGALQHRPMGFNQWANFYRHWVVIGSRIRVTIQTEPTGSVQACIGGVYVDDDLTAMTTWTRLVESGRSAYMPLQVGPVGGQQSFHGVKTMAAKFSSKKFFNVANVKDNMTRIGGAFNPATNPLEGAWYKIWVATTDQINAGALIEFTISTVTDYAVLLSEPHELPQS